MNNKKFNIPDQDVFRLLQYADRTKNISNLAVEDIIIPFPGFDEVKFDEKIWNVIKKSKYGQSYTLYIHTLRVCVELLLQYEHSNDKKYYDKAKEIIFSWLKFSESHTDNKMVWYDHTTANRTQVLIHFIYVSEKIGEKIDYNLFANTLRKHADVLMNDDIHNLNNHGLMMDRSLMILGNVLEEERYKQKGIYRAVNTFWFSFSHNGIHLENSPQYHNMVLRMYEEIEEYLNIRKESLGKPIIEYMKLAKEYSSLIVRPNRRIASLGDSSNGFKKIKKQYKTVYDREAGISIIQHEEPVPFFLTFICGYSTKVHKHKDDLSITLNYNKEDFFVDPGPYNYSKHKIRKYMTSKEAHSSFYLTDFDYSIKESNRYTRKISFESYVENDDFYMLKGYHHDYNGSHAKLSRTIITFKESDLIILLDDVKTSVTKHKLKFTQNFNLDKNVIINQNQDSLTLINKKQALTLKQFNKFNDFNIVEGDKEKPIALNTTGFGKATETKQLQYKVETIDKSVFITAVYDEKKVEKLDIIRKNNQLLVMYNDSNYNINV